MFDWRREWMGTTHVGMGLERTTPHVPITSSPALLLGARLQIWSHGRTHGSVEDFHLLLYASLEMIVSWISSHLSMIMTGSNLLLVLYLVWEQERFLGKQELHLALSSWPW